MTHTIIFDTDPGVDDAQAIALIMAHPDIEVLGLTTTFGNVRVETATRNALLLTELGVDPEAVREDYLMTNTAVDYDELAPRFAKRIRDTMGRDVGDREIRAFLGVEGDYLTTALDAMGDVSGYLRNELGLSETVIAQLHERLKTP